MLRKYLMAAICSNVVFQTIALQSISEATYEVKRMQVVYWTATFITIGVIMLSYKYDSNISLKILAWAILVFRNEVRLFDFEEYRLQGEITTINEIIDYL